MKIWKLIIFAIIGIFISGCITPKSYVDPKYKDISVSEIKPVKEKYNVDVDIEFQRNGERYKKADGELRKIVEQALIMSGVVTPSNKAGNITIKVICNNIADVEDARAKGFGTGLTFGAIGNAVTDFYQITIELTQGDKVFTKNYDHALHTTIGNKAPPVQNVDPSKPVDAFKDVIEDVVLQFIKDMQASDILTLEEILIFKRA